MNVDAILARADAVLKRRRERDSVLEARLGPKLTSSEWIEWVARQLCRRNHLDPDLMLTGIKERPVPQWFLFAQVAKIVLEKIEERMNG
ncbi:hypothetical protein [Magnetospirillum molischianum]|uniref:Uncharacterized protein n=1 Tax=Magnetospirillum molischianum DSM 120 TaxID=1150626 RepID=H8FYB2_MAGML|nr:hypothetical protein [Magnetospirillum molischianum]CCG43350.1 hypothetical protein PHAMO_80141 [Magnetospirillum molischianum DSM 120]